jgi:hypothetical protein
VQFDKLWNWIEGMPFTDEDWKVDANGDMVLVVTEEYLTKLLVDDENKASDHSPVRDERESDTGAYVVHNLPDYLCGTYRIRGVYNDKQELIDGERTYFYSTDF